LHEELLKALALAYLTRRFYSSNPEGKACPKRAELACQVSLSLNPKNKTRIMMLLLNARALMDLPHRDLNAQVLIPSLCTIVLGLRHELDYEAEEFLRAIVLELMAHAHFNFNEHNILYENLKKFAFNEEVEDDEDEDEDEEEIESSDDDGDSSKGEKEFSSHAAQQHYPEKEIAGNIMGESASSFPQSVEVRDPGECRDADTFCTRKVEQKLEVIRKGLSSKPLHLVDEPRANGDGSPYLVMFVCLHQVDTYHRRYPASCFLIVSFLLWVKPIRFADSTCGIRFVFFVQNPYVNMPFARCCSTFMPNGQLLMLLSKLAG